MATRPCATTCSPDDDAAVAWAPVDLRERPDGTTRHPWETSRARFFRRLISTHVSHAPSSVLDIGSGDSWFAAALLDSLPATAVIDCWDAHYTAADLAATIDPRLQRTAAAPSTRYPLVLALDVLEHVRDDAEFVAEAIAPTVQPGGLLVVSVPAYQWLFTSHDQALGHFRRHNRASLRALLQPSFTIVQEGSLFMSLVPPRAAQRLVELLRPPRQAPAQVQSGWRHGATVTRAVAGVLDADARLGLAAARRRVPLPGLSVWAVCRMDERG